MTALQNPSPSHPQGRHGPTSAGVDRDGTYVRIFQEVLPDFPFAKQSTNRVRQRLFERLVATHVPRREGLSALNVGCGQFALEVFGSVLPRCCTVSFDYTPFFAPMFVALKRAGLVQEDTSFFVGDIKAVPLPDASFDLIVVHDVFYEQALDAPTAVVGLSRLLRKGGHLYFDVLDRRAERLWKAVFPVQQHFRRYDVDAVIRHVGQNGFEIVEAVPVTENRSGLKWAALKAIQLTTGIANGYGVLVRKVA